MTEVNRVASSKQDNMGAIAVLIAALIMPMVGGCESLGGRTNSFDRKGEKIVLRMLDSIEMGTYAEDTWGKAKTEAKTETEAKAEADTEAKDTSESGPAPKPDPRIAQFNLRLNEVVLPGTESFVATGVAATAIPYVIDFAKAQLEKEAKRYEQQFGASEYVSAFWKRLNNDKKIPWGPKWAGFEITRYTDAFPSNDQKGEPAFRFVCAMQPSPDDERFFLLRPLFIQTQSAKTKVFFTSSKITTKVDIAIQGIWIDAKMKVNQRQIAAVTWEVSGYNIEDAKPKYFFEHATHGKPLTKRVKRHVAGWFVGVPVSHDVPGGAEGAGPFKLTLLVSERDESKAKTYFERSAKLVGDNKDKIVEAAGGSN